MIRLQGSTLQLICKQHKVGDTVQQEPYLREERFVGGQAEVGLGVADFSEEGNLEGATSQHETPSIRLLLPMILPLFVSSSMKKKAAQCCRTCILAAQMGPWTSSLVI